MGNLLSADRPPANNRATAFTSNFQGPEKSKIRRPKAQGPALGRGVAGDDRETL